MAQNLTTPNSVQADLDSSRHKTLAVPDKLHTNPSVKPKINFVKPTDNGMKPTDKAATTKTVDGKKDYKTRYNTNGNRLYVHPESEDEPQEMSRRDIKKNKNSSRTRNKIDYSGAEFED